MSRALGIDEATLADLPDHRASPRFTPLERAALDLAAAMTGTPVRVEDDLRRRLLELMTPAQYAELAATIAWENHRARLNRALGLRPLGFSDGAFCVLPARS